MADGSETKAAVQVSQATLAALPQQVARPKYDRDALTPGIIHIGLGNFHRAHQAWYLHRLMQKGQARDWAIIGAGVRAPDAEMRDKLKAQDYLTTLIELDPSGYKAEVCGAMIDFLPVEPTNAHLIARMAQPDIRIVSLTVTEGGYYQDPASGAFDPDHPDIQHDVAHPEAPRTAFGAMVAALRQRRAAGIGSFTGQSCDNLQGNGKVLRQTVVSLARLTDPELAEWIEHNTSFPNSMVDCIVPATGEREHAFARSFGIKDAAPVTHEHFRQWVIEDDFCAGRPPWEDVGATLSNHVHDYEMMKIRILNGGHQLIAGAAEVLGIETISDAMADPDIRAFLRKTVQTEIAIHVPPVPDCTASQYLELVDSRFANPEIVDTTRRVAFDGTSRHPGFLIPSIRDCIDKGVSARGLALASAIWARYCFGLREDGTEVLPNDPYWPDLLRTAEQAKKTPDAWLKMETVYGDLGQNSSFAADFGHWLGQIYANGVRSALQTYVAGGLSDR